MATRSILPNSNSLILQPIATPRGTFQVIWSEPADSHVLQFNGADIAAHHNGFSCHGLALRIIEVWQGKRLRQYAADQFDYVIRCGGSGNLELFRSILQTA